MLEPNWFLEWLKQLFPIVWESMFYAIVWVILNITITSVLTMYGNDN